MRCLRSAQLPAHSSLPCSPVCLVALCVSASLAYREKTIQCYKIKNCKKQQPKMWLLEAGGQSLLCEIIQNK